MSRLRLAPFCGAIDSVDFGDAAAEQYGVIRAQLKRAGTPIGPNDLMIASIALANDASLATPETWGNSRGYPRFDSNRSDRWMADQARPHPVGVVKVG